MMPNNLAAISEHLQFLGYKIETIDDQSFAATHPRKPNIVVKHFDMGTQLTSPFWVTEAAEADRIGYLEAVNQANRKTTICRYISGVNKDLYIVTWFLREYERTAFATFLDLWDCDTVGLFQQLDLRSYVG